MIGTPGASTGNTLEDGEYDEYDEGDEDGGDDEDDEDEGEEEFGTRFRARVCLWRLPFSFSLCWSFLRLLFDSLVTIRRVSAGSLPCSSPLWPIVTSISSSLPVVRLTLAARRKM